MVEKKVLFNIRRQQGPNDQPYWEAFEFPYYPGDNVISGLLYIREHPITVEGKKVAPVVWENNCMEEVCGACTMLINGTPRQACAALIEGLPQPIEIKALSKFPVIRDLLIDRSAMFEALIRVKAWIEIDHTSDIHRHAPLISPGVQAIRYLFSRCMSCGCCLEACPQYHRGTKFVGAAAIGQVKLHNAHPTGRYSRDKRLNALMEDGGIADCGNAQNCVKVCPKHIPLTEAIAEVGRQTIAQWLRDMFISRSVRAK